jgi:ribosomal protein S27AE
VSMSIEDFKDGEKEAYDKPCPKCAGKTYLSRSGKHVKWSCYNCGYIKFLAQDWREFIIPIGKYNGKKLLDIANTDPAYCLWAAGNMSGSIAKKFAQAAEESQPF